MAFLSKAQKAKRLKAKQDTERRMKKLRADIDKIAGPRKKLKTEKLNVKALYAMDAPSVPTSDSIGVGHCKRSVMDPRTLEKETPKQRDEIIAKSKRISLGYHKGAMQYDPHGSAIKTNGRRDRS